MSEDLTGRRLGHYRIDGVLGKGGMSVMYRATDIRLGRKVALKVIGAHLGEDAEFRERFVDEARNTSAIDHSNVVPLYDFGEVDGLLYIAMRLVDGSDLASLIKGGPITPHRAQSLLGQVAEALDTLHTHGLVHLDVKPANVLVTSRESATEHVYLADFGLTRRGATGHRTRSGDFLGSPTYAAPEHLRGEPVDGRTDGYSLACVLFACLTGRPPFQGSVPEVIKGHLTLDPPKVSAATTLPPGIDRAALDEVVRRGMAKDPESRFPDCRALIAAARQVLVPARRPAAGMNAPGVPPGRFSPPPQGFPQRPPAQPLPRTQRDARQAPSPYRPGAAGAQEPIRLRPPVPAGSTAFTADDGGNRWLVPVVVGVVAIVVIVGAIFFLSQSGESGQPPPTSPAPEIPVGPATTVDDEPSTKSTTRSATRTLPPSLPIRPSGG